MASRLTFRKKAGDVCWQKTLRDHHLAEGVPPVPHLSVKKSIVRPVSRRLAEQIIFKYEWLGTMSTTSIHFGIFFGIHCAGVTCVGIGASMAGTTHHKKFMVGKSELLTLARGACVHWAPPGTNSKLVGWTCRLLAQKGIGKVIWATSDSDAGEIGTIYQACNWTYIGTSSRPKEAEIVAPNGRTVNNRNLSTWAKKRGITYSEMRRQLLEQGWRFQRSNPKHRYAYQLDRADDHLRERLESMSLPYPKRASVAQRQSAAPTSAEAAVQLRPGRSKEAT